MREAGQCQRDIEKPLPELVSADEFLVARGDGPPAYPGAIRRDGVPTHADETVSRIDHRWWAVCP